MPYPATPKTWVAGDVLTAAQLNAELRDALLGAFPLGPPDTAWTGYTPTLTQSGAVTKTVTYAKYQRIGRLIVVEIVLAVTGPGTASNNVTASLPVTAATAAGIGAGLPVGSGWIYDVSAGSIFPGIACLGSTTTAVLLPTSVNTAVYLGGGGSPFAAALASGDAVGFSMKYEAAT